MLGLVLTPYGRIPNAYPYEINKSGPDATTYLCPSDPYYFQRGEYGFFADTPFGGPRAKLLKGLGAIPTDAEIGKHYYSWYTPVQSAWVYAKDPYRYIPGPWVPPNNANALPPFGPPTSLGAATIEDLMKSFEDYHRKQFTLSLLATTVGVAASAIAFYRTYHGLRKEREAERGAR